MRGEQWPLQHPRKSGLSPVMRHASHCAHPSTLPFLTVILLGSLDELSGGLHQLQALNSDHGEKLDYRRRRTQLHQLQELFIRIGPEVMDQITFTRPSCFYAKFTMIRPTFEQATAQTPGLHLRRSNKRSQGTSQLLPFPLRYNDAHLLDDHVLPPKRELATQSVAHRKFGTGAVSR